MFNYRWLQDYNSIRNNIDYLTYSIEDTERELQRWISGDLQHVKLASDSKGAMLENLLFEMKKNLVIENGRLNKLNTLIETFEDLDSLILRKKYIEGKTLSVIAEELGYSHSNIRMKHAEIMRTLKRFELLYKSI